jgi:histidyl-tRNA synthetase
MKPSIPKGTRDFLPHQVVKRKYIFDTIESVFKKYAYVPIETPTMENLATLSGKYGEEGDRLLFKVLNNGDFLAKADQQLLEEKNSNKVVHQISKRGLRYDLTVPFARFVVMHQNELTFPFKRYQIQPVWRADRPQKGRYQEFYQCDVDVIGSNSLMYEAELVHIFDDAFNQLKIPVTIMVNNRKVLFGLAEYAGVADQFVDMTTSIDKIDKIGVEGVKEDLAKKGFSQESINKICDALGLKGLAPFKEIFKDSETGLKGIEELETFHEYCDMRKPNNKIEFDISLARGLNYYTGCIFEVKADNVQIGSLGGGGRYADLTGVFGLKDVSGVGVSFGAARIFDVMEECKLFPSVIQNQTKLLLVAFDEETHKKAFEYAVLLRAQNLAIDIYPEPLKMKKQMKYAHDNNIPYVGLIGSQELENNTIGLKNMDTGDQSQVTIDQLIQKIQ